MTVDDGKRYVGHTCTLNGKTAKVIGARNFYATVATLDGEHLGDWSWVAIARIMQRGGDFRL